jgi:ABC-type transport system involved in cytochrome bd biosynthesis fused ATPase/permease subunit
LKQFINNIRAILSAEERRRFGTLIILDILISVLDILFLAMLIFVIHFYTQPSPQQRFPFFPKWLLGCSGTGKTTILNLLLGFLTPCAGEISINGMTSDPTTIQNYWKNNSYVRQQPFLIHDSISRNIILDNPYNEERLQEVIRVAGLQELMNTFPEAHEKIIMENGKNLSGGQRQRIAIARALYKNAGLILLDEPFNELDETTELAFLSHFQYLSQHGKMIILITHNKASFSHCNKMISLDEHQL